MNPWRNNRNGIRAPRQPTPRVTSLEGWPTSSRPRTPGEGWRQQHSVGLPEPAACPWETPLG
eukprot:11188960-Lingulodinium_polyedra.AAC.1